MLLYRKCNKVYCWMEVVFTFRVFLSGYAIESSENMPKISLRKYPQIIFIACFLKTLLGAPWEKGTGGNFFVKLILKKLFAISVSGIGYSRNKSYSSLIKENYLKMSSLDKYTSFLVIHFMNKLVHQKIIIPQLSDYVNYDKSTKNIQHSMICCKWK